MDQEVACEGQCQENQLLGIQPFNKRTEVQPAFQRTDAGTRSKSHLPWNHF